MFEKLEKALEVAASDTVVSGWDAWNADRDAFRVCNRAIMAGIEALHAQMVERGLANAGILELVRERGAAIRSAVCVATRMAAFNLHVVIGKTTLEPGDVPTTLVEVLCNLDAMAGAANTPGLGEAMRYTAREAIVFTQTNAYAALAEVPMAGGLLALDAMHLAADRIAGAVHALDPDVAGQLRMHLEAATLFMDVALSRPDECSHIDMALLFEHNLRLQKIAAVREVCFNEDTDAGRETLEWRVRQIERLRRDTFDYPRMVHIGRLHTSAEELRALYCDNLPDAGEKTG